MTADLPDRNELLRRFFAGVTEHAFAIRMGVADPPLVDVISYMSLFDKHYRGFMRGQINTEDVVYFLSICFVFLMLASRFMAARRWR